MNRTTISWVRNPDPIAGTGFTWNPFAGCSHKATGSGGYFEDVPRWSGEVRFFPEKLAEPIRRRTPSGIFVGDMGDIGLLTNEQIAAIFGVMAACPQHRFYLLTKRPERLRQWFEWCDNEQTDSNGLAASWYPFAVELAKHGIGCNEELRRTVASHPRHSLKENRWPLPNVWIGASVCTQTDADKNISDLLHIPAAVRFLSVEPLLEAITLSKPEVGEWPRKTPTVVANGKEWDDWKYWMARDRGVQWVIIGGESGPRTRPCHVEWIRSLARQCKEAGVSTWVKQLGARAVDTAITGLAGVAPQLRLALRDRSGADPSEWPEDLRVREMPKVRP